MPGMAHLLGYARVSTFEQNPDLQVDELISAGCWKVCTDRASRRSTGARSSRAPGAAAAGDTLVVRHLDRLGRSLRHLIEVVTELDERGVGFRSLRESIDTTTAGGRLVLHLFGALAQFEREIIRDRTLAGLSAARARGRSAGGRASWTPSSAARPARCTTSANSRSSRSPRCSGAVEPRSTGASEPARRQHQRSARWLGRRLPSCPCSRGSRPVRPRS